MKVRKLYLRSVLFGCLYLAAIPLGGCKASCDTDSDVEDAVEDVSDDVQDAADDIADNAEDAADDIADHADN